MKAGELYVDMGLNMGKFTSALGAAQAAAKSTGDIIRNALSVTIGVGAFQALKTGFDSTIKSAINFNSMIENASIGFETMLGSAEEAQSFIEDMGDFAATTPFEYPELLETSQRLMAVGFAAEDVMPTLKAVGDAAAGLGKSSEAVNLITTALGQMKLAGRVNAQDMMQLTSQGIPAWQILADAAGKTTAEIRKMSEQGLIPADWAVQELIKGMERNFPNMMKKMEDTWQGNISTIKDTWTQMLGAMTNDLFTSINDWLTNVKNFAVEFYNIYKEQGLEQAVSQMISPEFADTMTQITDALKTFGNAIQTVIDFVKNNWAIFEPLLKTIIYLILAIQLATKVIIPLITTIMKVVSWVKNLIFAFQAVAGGAATFAEGLALVVNPAGWVVAAIVGIISVVILLIKYWDYVKTAAVAAWQYISAGAMRTAGVIAAVVGYIIKALSFLVPAWHGTADSIIETGKSWIEAADAQLQLANTTVRSLAYIGRNNKAQKELTKTLDNNAKVTKNVAATSTDAANGQQKLAKAAKKAQKAAQGSLLSFDELHTLQQELAANVPTGIGVPAPNFGGGGGAPVGGTAPAADTIAPGVDFSKTKKDTGGFINWLKKTWKSFTNWARKLWNTVKKSWNDFWDWVERTYTWENVKKVWNDFWAWVGRTFTWDNIKKTWGNFKNWAGDFWETTKKHWRTFWGWVNTFLKWSGIKSKWEDFKAWAGKLWDKVETKWDDFWDWVGKTFSWDNIQKKWKNFQGWAEKLWPDAQSNWSDFWSWVGRTFTWKNIQAQWKNFQGWIGNFWPQGGWSNFWSWVGRTFTWKNIQAQWKNFQGWIGSFWPQSKWSAFWSWVGRTFTWKNIQAQWKNFQGWVTNLWNGVGATWNRVWKGIANTVIRFVNGIIDAINKMISAINSISITIPSGVPWIGSRHIGFNLRTIGHVPYLAKGGIVTAPTLAVLGEAGAEAVVPLSKNNEFTEGIQDAVYNAIREAMNTNAGQPIELTVNIGSSTVYKDIINGINAVQRQAGKTLITV